MDVSKDVGREREHKTRMINRLNWTELGFYGHAKESGHFLGRNGHFKTGNNDLQPGGEFWVDERLLMD